MRFFNSQIEELQVQTECFLRELILLRDNTLFLSNYLGFSREELNVFINDIYTAWLGLIHSFLQPHVIVCFLLLFFAIATFLCVRFARSHITKNTIK